MKKLLYLIYFIYINNYKFNIIIKFNYFFLGIDFNTNSFLGIEFYNFQFYLFSWNVKETNYLLKKFLSFFNNHNLGIDIY